MKNFHNSEALDIMLNYGIEISLDLVRTFEEMFINLKLEPLSRFFKEELSYFRGCKMTSIVEYDAMALKRVDLLGEFAINNHNDINIKGLVITCSDIDSENYQKLNDQIDLLPEHIICIFYGGVRLTSKNNQVEIFVFQ